MTVAAIWTGGIYHPFDTAAPALGAILAECGYEPHVSFELDDTLGRLRPDALLVVFALRWSMTQAEKYAPFRAQWAYATPPPARDAIRTHVANGGALLALHTATLCFDDWPQWADVVGGTWVWGRSHHPERSRARVVLGRDSPLTRGLADFELVDEVYADLAISPDATVLGHAEALPADGSRCPDGLQPVLWSHPYGRGRVVYDALGHDAESLNHPVHRRFIKRAALWASGRSDHDVEAC